jgi:hypothetical protein
MHGSTNPAAGTRRLVIAGEMVGHPYLHNSPNAARAPAPASSSPTEPSFPGCLRTLSQLSSYATPKAGVPACLSNGRGDTLHRMKLI